MTECKCGAQAVTEEMREAIEMVLDWWHEWRTEAPEPEEAVAFQALEAAFSAQDKGDVK